MTLQERLISLETLINQKVNQLNQLEASRNALTQEIVEIRGKINLLKELLSSEKSQEEPK